LENTWWQGPRAPETADPRSYEARHGVSLTPLTRLTQCGDDMFTPDDIKDSTLVVCLCGRVVLNQAGLIKHRLRYDCPEATQRPYIRGSTPLTSPPPSTALSSHRAVPSSSPLSSAPPSTLSPPGDLLAGLTLDAPPYKSPTPSSIRQRSV
jgi:hypothetical protein